jgi:hypothetical protein
MKPRAGFLALALGAEGGLVLPRMRTHDEEVLVGWTLAATAFRRGAEGTPPRLGRI